MNNKQIKKITKLKNIVDNGFFETSEKLEEIQNDIDNAMSHLVVAENSFHKLNIFLADILLEQAHTVEGDKNE